MMNLMKADMYRIFKHAAIYAAIVLILLMMGVSIFLVSPGNVGINQASFDSNGEIMFGNTTVTMEELSDMGIGDLRKFMLQQENYQLDKDILSVNVNLYYVFIFVVAVIVVADFNVGSVKNTLSSAISRNRYFASKCITAVLVCLVLFFLNTYIMYFANIICNGKQLSSDLWSVTKITLLQLPAMAALVSLLIGIAFAVKKMSIYNLITIPFMIVLELVMGYAARIFRIPEKAMSYMPKPMFAQLAGQPTGTYVAISYAVCAGLIVLFLAMGYGFFRKAEIK